jgi:hypothetical protein
MSLNSNTSNPTPLSTDEQASVDFASQPARFQTRSSLLKDIERFADRPDSFWDGVKSTWNRLTSFVPSVKNLEKSGKQVFNEIKDAVADVREGGVPNIGKIWSSVTDFVGDIKDLPENLVHDAVNIMQPSVSRDTGKGYATPPSVPNVNKTLIEYKTARSSPEIQGVTWNVPSSTPQPVDFGYYTGRASAIGVSQTPLQTWMGVLGEMITVFNAHEQSFVQVPYLPQGVQTILSSWLTEQIDPLNLPSRVYNFPIGMVSEMRVHPTWVREWSNWWASAKEGRMDINFSFNTSTWGDINNELIYNMARFFMNDMDYLEWAASSHVEALVALVQLAMHKYQSSKSMFDAYVVSQHTDTLEYAEPALGYSSAYWPAFELGKTSGAMLMYQRTFIALLKGTYNWPDENWRAAWTRQDLALVGLTKKTDYSVPAWRATYRCSFPVLSTTYARMAVDSDWAENPVNVPLFNYLTELTIRGPTYCIFIIPDDIPFGTPVLSSGQTPTTNYGPGSLFNSPASYDVCGLFFLDQYLESWLADFSPSVLLNILSNSLNFGSSYAFADALECLTWVGTRFPRGMKITKLPDPIPPEATIDIDIPQRKKQTSGKKEIQDIFGSIRRPVRAAKISKPEVSHIELNSDNEQPQKKKSSYENKSYETKPKKLLTRPNAKYLNASVIRKKGDLLPKTFSPVSLWGQEIRAAMERRSKARLGLARKNYKEWCISIARIYYVKFGRSSDFYHSFIANITDRGTDPCRILFQASSEDKALFQQAFRELPLLYQNLYSPVYYLISTGYTVKDNNNFTTEYFYTLAAQNGTGIETAPDDEEQDQEEEDQNDASSDHDDSYEVEIDYAEDIKSLDNEKKELKLVNVEVESKETGEIKLPKSNYEEGEQSRYVEDYGVDKADGTGNEYADMVNYAGVPPVAGSSAIVNAPMLDGPAFFLEFLGDVGLYSKNNNYSVFMLFSETESLFRIIWEQATKYRIGYDNFVWSLGIDRDSHESLTQVKLPPLRLIWPKMSDWANNLFGQSPSVIKKERWSLAYPKNLVFNGWGPNCVPVGANPLDHIWWTPDAISTPFTTYYTHMNVNPVRDLELIRTRMKDPIYDIDVYPPDLRTSLRPSDVVSSTGWSYLSILFADCGDVNDESDERQGGMYRLASNYVSHNIHQRIMTSPRAYTITAGISWNWELPIPIWQDAVDQIFWRSDPRAYLWNNSRCIGWYCLFFDDANATDLRYGGMYVSANLPLAGEYLSRGNEQLIAEGNIETGVVDWVTDLGEKD